MKPGWPQKRLEFDSESDDNVENKNPKQRSIKYKIFNTKNFNPKNLSFDDSSDNEIITKKQHSFFKQSSSQQSKRLQINKTSESKLDGFSNFKNNILTSNSHFGDSSSTFVDESSRVDMKTRSGKVCGYHISNSSDKKSESKNSTGILTPRYSNSNYSNSTPPLSPRIQSLMISPKISNELNNPATPRSINRKITTYAQSGNSV